MTSGLGGTGLGLLPARFLHEKVQKNGGSKIDKARSQKDILYRDDFFSIDCVYIPLLLHEVLNIFLLSIE